MNFGFFLFRSLPSIFNNYLGAMRAHSKSFHFPKL